jgi:hypothetical protein
VPQPISRAYVSGMFSIGARLYRPPHISIHMRCWSSRRSISCYRPGLGISGFLQRKSGKHRVAWRTTYNVIWQVVFVVGALVPPSVVKPELIICTPHGGRHAVCVGERWSVRPEGARDAASYARRTRSPRIRGKNHCQSDSSPPRAD